MPRVWDAAFGFLTRSANEGGAAMPVVVAEWGGLLEGKDIEWQRAFLRYLASRRISGSFVSFNPEVATGGLLIAWGGELDAPRLDLLSALPTTPVPTSVQVHTPPPQPRPPLAPPPPPSAALPPMPAPPAPPPAPQRPPRVDLGGAFNRFLDVGLLGLLGAHGTDAYVYAAAGVLLLGSLLLRWPKRARAAGRAAGVAGAGSAARRVRTARDEEELGESLVGRDAPS